jgi:hypothetical protein
LNKFDAFYIVLDLEAKRMKFGITNGDATQRLSQHSSYGFTKTDMLLIDYPQANMLESFLKKSLKLLNIEPLFGHECFRLEHLETVRHLVNAFQSIGCTEITEEYPTVSDEMNDRIILDIRRIWPIDTRHMPGYAVAALLSDYDPYWHRTLSQDDSTAARRLALRLRPYGITASTHRIGGKPTHSYAREQFHTDSLNHS